MGNLPRRSFNIDPFILIAMKYHKIVLAGGNGYLGTVLAEHFKKLADEVIASELRCGAACFDRLLGTCVGEDVLDRIFSKFCIGK